tara:strand:+ start:1214 stop:1414 length:201 start_codon:yes stop_codon:yes gene_type:complete
MTDVYTELKEIAVAASYQKRRVGSNLVEQWLLEVDAAHGSAFVSATSNSKSFFEKFGFETKKYLSF